MNGIHPIQSGDALGCDACLLDSRNKFAPLRSRVCMPATIQNASDAPFLKCNAQLVFIQGMGLVENNVDPGFVTQLAFTKHIQRELSHFSHLVFQCHFSQQRFHGS